MNPAFKLAAKFALYLVCIYSIVFMVMHQDDGSSRVKRTVNLEEEPLASECFPRNTSRPRSEEGIHRPNQLYYEYLISKEPEVFVEKAPEIDPNTKVIIIALSKNTDYQARSDVRESWANSDNPYIKNKSATVIFLTGDDKEDIGCLNNEFDAHGDLLVAKALDSYRGLVYKLVIAFRYLSKNYPQAHIMKIDLDCILDVTGLMGLLDQQKDPDFIYGYLFYSSRPIRDPIHQWYVPEYAFKGRLYPWYVNGNVYIISGKSMQNLLTALRGTHVIEIEDLFFTGILREKVNGKIDHMPGYRFGVPDYMHCPDEEGRRIIVHGMARDRIVERYNEFMNWKRWDCSNDPKPSTKAEETATDKLPEPVGKRNNRL